MSRKMVDIENNNNLLREQKKALRKEIARRKRTLSPEQWQEKSELLSRVLADHITSLPFVRIGLFLSLADEWDTAPLVSLLREKGYTLLVPRVEGEDIRFYVLREEELVLSSSYAIREPTAPVAEALVPELIVLPGVAFDTQGYRLGRGKGYYDRYLSVHSSEVCYTVGSCFDIQRVEFLPFEAHDRRVDSLVTESEVRIFD